MKLQLASFLLLAIVLASTAFTAELPYHPYRKVEGKYYSVQPIYNWASIPEKERYKIAQPMKAWIVAITKNSGGFIVEYEVLSVAKDGLIIAKKDFNAYQSDTRYREPIFLKNYPEKDSVVDGAKIQFIALRTGTYSYTADDGTAKTIAAYDYGTPYDPTKLIPKAAPTNQPPGKPTER